jgi:hypothetical protein
VKVVQKTIDALNRKNTQLLAETVVGGWMHSAFIISFTSGSESDVKEMIQGYMKETEELRVKLLESEAMCQQLPQASSWFLA